MQQQQWKRDMDEAAKAKGEVEGDGDQDAAPQKSRRGRKPGAKAKAKAKAGAKAKAKAKAKATAAKSRAKGKAKETPVEEADASELITPPPKKPRVRTSGTKRKQEDGSTEAAAAPVTFAKRYRPKTTSGAALWDALRAAFQTVAMMIRAPTTVQARRLKILFDHSV